MMIGIRVVIFPELLQSNGLLSRVMARLRYGLPAFNKVKGAYHLFK